jgi:hypothetical protein
MLLDRTWLAVGQTPISETISPEISPSPDRRRLTRAMEAQKGARRERCRTRSWWREPHRRKFVHEICESKSGERTSTQLLPEMERPTPAKYQSNRSHIGSTSDLATPIPGTAVWCCPAQSILVRLAICPLLGFSLKLSEINPDRLARGRFVANNGYVRDGRLWQERPVPQN